MARSSGTIPGRSKKLPTSQVIWIDSVMREMHARRQAIRFFRPRDNAFYPSDQRVAKARLVCAAYHAGVDKESLCAFYDLNRMDWDRIMGCFNQLPLDEQAKACMNASRTIASHAKRPRR
jgi:hypothetical protein